MYIDIHDARLDKSTCHMPGGSQGKLPQYSQYQIFIQTTINYHYDYIYLYKFWKYTTALC